MRALKMSVVAGHSEGDNDLLRAVIKANPLKTVWEIAEKQNVNHSMVILHLKQIGNVKKFVSVCLMRWLQTQNICHFKVSSLILRNNKPFLNWIVMCNEKWILYNNQQQPASVVGPRKSSKALPKDTLAPKRGHGNCLVICCWSDPLQLSES